MFLSFAFFFLDLNSVLLSYGEVSNPSTQYLDRELESLA